ncbi:hypothetical protein KBJ98_02020 [Flavobacterium sp. F-328]|uniref:Uncharacterized protein n=1 Tax=Flavobacterium erciyesense TaxID=2825842 RepID=A0ABS5D0E5_9FLAO|nr:hypothetical protein [Flavobacterium erciyesense]MBQ0907472.1 hypothetical protein [Flavobacterium erciyesense]
MDTDFEQLGGFCKVEFFLIEDTSNWPIVLNDETANQIILPECVVEDYGKIIDESIDVNIPPKQAANGTTYPIEIVFNFSNRVLSLEKYLDKYQNKSVVALLTLNTGIKKLYGTNETPLIFNWKIDEGKKIEDAGLIMVSIKGEMRHRPVHYKL